MSFDPPSLSVSGTQGSNPEGAGDDLALSDTQLVLAALARKFDDPDNYQLPNSERAPANTEPQVDWPRRKNYPAPSFSGCPLCKRPVVRAFDAKIDAFRFFDKVERRRGTYIIGGTSANPQAYRWGHTGGSHVIHQCESPA